MEPLSNKEPVSTSEAKSVFEPRSFKDIFDKYMVVWVWSIFVSINTALTYNVFNLYESSKWEKLNIFIIPIFLLAVIMALVSWISLFNFFRAKILSLIINAPDEWIENLPRFDTPEQLENFHKTKNSRKEAFAYRQLKNSFFYIIFAIFFRFLIPLIEMIFGLLYH